MLPLVQPFFDPITSTFSYVVHAGDGSQCAIIDSVLDYDPKSGRTSNTSVEPVIAFVRAHRLRVQWLLETHAHADHLSAAQYLKSELGGKIAIGEQICTVQRTFKDIFNLGADVAGDGTQFEHLFKPDEAFQIGALMAHALHVPGHTPADMAYVIGDAAFVGDTLFMPDVGSARCDFPGGDAHALYGSVQKLLSLPPETRLFMCHDYPPPSRAACCETTVAVQRRENIHLHDGVAEADFVDMRTRRDRTLGMPTLILPSVQVNIRAGAMPAPESNGVRYLKIPIDLF
ncbi:MBL fold metallo-hydrolase [Trinickia sp. LjRoot230]|uniref:MBL fold metallo-hydrolase n=1 Tax=Trinickia sp. LjRoot230 TaxID=3342288 RepID=UPI003ED0AA7C